MLYPHVRATPDWTQGFDRAWPQNLYLNPTSPLVSMLAFPPGFDISKTPLVTFRRIDTLLEGSYLDALYRSLHPDSRYLQNASRTSILSDEPLWNLAPEEYVRIFTAPRPEGNYATMVVSTGGHWTTHLFEALRDPSMFNEGIQNVVNFFPEAMRAWADQVQALLHAAARDHPPPPPPVGVGLDKKRALEEAQLARAGTGRPRQVVVRAYLPGHEDCHDFREPISRYTKGKNGWYNWNQIGDMNRAFEVRSSQPVAS